MNETVLSSDVMQQTYIVVPAYNEELLIEKTLTTMPEFVDTIIVVNDGSSDGTKQKIESLAEKDSRIVLVDHPVNLGLGQSLIDGYLKSRELQLVVTAVMAGVSLGVRVEITEKEHFPSF